MSDYIEKFPIYHVTEDASEEPEPQGAKPKFWFQNSAGIRILYKQCRENTGEAWAEKAAEQLATVLGLPCAQYDLAVWKDKKGVITPSFYSGDARLKPGNELLDVAVMRYKQHSDNIRKAYMHTVSVAMDTIRKMNVSLPASETWREVRGIETAGDLFTGYLLLDAWIGNGDRHHENWAIVERREENRFIGELAPTYDHASSLGRELRDKERVERMKTLDNNRTLEAYCSKTKSAFYNEGDWSKWILTKDAPRAATPKPISPLDAFRAASLLCPAASDIWLGRLQAVTEADEQQIFAKFPAEWITEPSSQFALKMLCRNQNELMKIRKELP